jgi:EGF-like domain
MVGKSETILKKVRRKAEYVNESIYLLNLTKMKNFLILSSIILILSSCKKKETPDLCVDVNCSNGGTCVNGTCECPEYYTGTNCTDFKVPLIVTAQSLVLSYVPEPCQTWDGTVFTSGKPPRDADVYIQLYKNGNLYYDTRSIYQTDTDCFGGCYYYNSISFDPAQLYELRVYDLDLATQDDLMGNYTFRPWDFMTMYTGDSGYPSTIGCIIFDNMQSCSINNYSSSIDLHLKLNDITYGF